MGSTSESILHVAPHVKLKKNEGELYLMSERLGWMVGNKESFSVSHKYCDIKTQKISPEGKAKVQLQVCLHDGTATTFQFVNPGGTADQMADRDKVKELLQQLLPKFKRIVNKELEEKQRLLSENPHLAQLYMDLVQSQVISPEEFWTDHATPFVKKLAESRNAQQDVGVSASFLTDIKPVSDGGCNTGVRYNITGELMASIFRTYPSVKEKHLKCVPAKMTEEEFWKKFFQSHYFHRDKNIMDSKDIFADCGKKDELVVSKDLKANINDPLVNLTALNDVDDEESNNNASSSKPSAIANQNMIRRFNQHSILVLKASEQLPAVEPDASAAAVVADTPEPQIQAPNKRARLLEATYYDDLESKETDNAVQLHLSRIERYLSGPTAAMQLQTGMNGNGSAAVSGGELSQDEFRTVVTRWMRGVPDGGYNPADVLSSVTTLAVMTDLSVGGSLMKPSAPNSATHLPVELQKELKQLYSSLNEILRHFWAAFPPSTPQLVEKVSRMIDALNRFKLNKMTLFEQKLTQASSTTEAENVLRPLKFQLDAAMRRYTQWNNRQPASSRSAI